MTEGRLSLLHHYLEVTRKMAALVQSENEFVDVETLGALLAERDRLIEAYGACGGGELTSSEQPVAEQIRQLDKVVMRLLQDKQQDTRERSADLQHHKLGLHAYTKDYAYSSAFIDKRK